MFVESHKDTLRPSIAHLINHRSFLDDGYCAIITFIFKSGDSLKASNYSLLMFLSQVAKKVVIKQLLLYF